MYLALPQREQDWVRPLPSARADCGESTLLGLAALMVSGWAKYVGLEVGGGLSAVYPTRSSDIL